MYTASPRTQAFSVPHDRTGVHVLLQGPACNKSVIFFLLTGQVYRHAGKCSCFCCLPAVCLCCLFVIGKCVKAPSSLSRSNLQTQRCFHGLTVHTIRQENGAFGKRYSNRRNLKTTALRITVGRKHNGAFRTRWRKDGHVISVPQISSSVNPKSTVIVAFSNFPS